MFLISSMLKAIPEKAPGIKSPWRLALAFSVLLLLARTLFVIYGPLDLAPDEAQYWDWSRRLDWSYATKPPLTAWLLALSTAIFGNTYFGVRFFALLGQVAVPLLAMAIARQVAPANHQNNAGWWAFGLTSAAPLIAAGGLVMSPDVPSLVLWLVALWILVRQDFQAPPRWRPWLLLGLVVGLAGLAKPTAALFFPLLGIFLLWQAPRWLLKPHVYATGKIALLCQAPVFYWNATHDWAMFRHVLDQTDSDSRWSGWHSLLDFLGGQAGVLGPLTFVALLVTLVVAWRRPQLRVLWVFAAVPFAFFLYAATGGRVQPNWPVLGMVVGLILTAVVMVNWPRWVKILLLAGLLLNATASLLLYDTFLLRAVGVPLKIKNDPTKPLQGWRGLGGPLGSLLARYPGAVVLTTRYQTTSGLAFHTPSNPHVAYMNPGWRRENHYDFQPAPTLAGKRVLYVNEGMTLLPQVAEKFEKCTHLQDLKATRRGLTLRTAAVYLCEGAKTPWK